MSSIIPISGLIPTKNRSNSLSQTLDHLAKQELQPAEVIVIDASDNDDTEALCGEPPNNLISQLRWLRAYCVGAAAQRNEGINLCRYPFVLFMDDDIRFEPHCVERLWKAINSDEKIGGVNAMITNQRYLPPGLASRMLFTLLHGQREDSFAGKVIGPAINLLPEDRGDLPEVVPVEWLNTTCTLYRREALPAPPFDSVFSGYSLMEDLALSLHVARRWKLANARTARIFHDSQSGVHKSNERAMAAMELVNRYFVMTAVLDRRGTSAYLKLLLWEIFQLMACIVGSNSSRSKLLEMLLGKWQGFREIRCLNLCQQMADNHEIREG